MLHAYFCEPIDNRDERRKPEPLFFRFKLVTKLVNVFVSVNSLDFVILYKASEEKASLDILDIFFVNYFLSHF